VFLHINLKNFKKSSKKSAGFSLNYKNTMGINLKQTISLLAEINNGQNTLNIIFENISSQTITL